MKTQVAYLSFILITLSFRLFAQTSVIPHLGGMVNYSLFDDLPINTFPGGSTSVDESWVLMPFIGLGIEQQVLKRFKVDVNVYVSRNTHEEVSIGGFVGRLNSIYTTNVFQADIQGLILLYSNLHISSGIRLMNVRFNKRVGDGIYPNAGTWTWAVSSQKGIHFIGYMSGIQYDIGALRLGLNYVSLTRTNRNDSIWIRNKSIEMTVSYKIQILKKRTGRKKIECPKF